MPDEVVPDDTSPCETQFVGILLLLKPGVRRGPKKSVQCIFMCGSKMKQKKLWKDRSGLLYADPNERKEWKAESLAKSLL